MSVRRSELDDGHGHDGFDAASVNTSTSNQRGPKRSHDEMTLENVLHNPLSPFKRRQMQIESQHTPQSLRLGVSQELMRRLALKQNEVIDLIRAAQDVLSSESGDESRFNLVIRQVGDSTIEITTRPDKIEEVIEKVVEPPSIMSHLLENQLYYIKLEADELQYDIHKLLGLMRDERQD